MKHRPDPHYRHRFPAEIISHAVWLYHTFCLSLRDVELLLAERGVEVSYETIRRWCRKFAQSFANRLRRRRSRPGDRWHMDEVFIKISGVQHYLWRAVDQHGTVLDILVQSRRNTQAACAKRMHSIKRFFKKLLKGLRYVPRVIVTDKLGSYGAARKAILPGVEHRQHKGLNNRAELPPADPPAGTAHKTLQVSPAGPAIPLRPRPHPPAQPPPPAPDERRRASRLPSPGLRRLEAGDVCPHRGMTTVQCPFASSACLIQVNVTMPLSDTVALP